MFLLGHECQATSRVRTAGCICLHTNCVSHVHCWYEQTWIKNRIFCPPKMSKWKIQTDQITTNLKYQTVLRDESARHLHLCCTHKADAYWTLMMTWLVFVSSRFWSHPHDSTPEDKLLSSAGQNPSYNFRPFDQQQQDY